MRGIPVWFSSSNFPAAPGAQAMELALMQREDCRFLILEEIHAARLSSPQAMAAHAVPFNYVAPKVKARPRLPRVPPPGHRVFPKQAPQGYSFVSGPAPATWSETSGRTRSAAHPAASASTSQPLLGQGRPITAFFPFQAKALPITSAPATTSFSRPAAPPATSASRAAKSAPKQGSSRRTHAPHRR